MPYIPGPMAVHQGRWMHQDQIDAMAYWADKEWKKWAVDITAGPEKKPTYTRTVYCSARTRARAIETVKSDMPIKPPSRARYAARLAGPRELGCVPTPGADMATAGKPAAPAALFMPSADALAQAARRAGARVVFAVADQEEEGAAA